MKTIRRQLPVLLGALALFAGVGQIEAQGTTFTYQGRLDSNGVPVNGFYDFEFAVYSNAAGTGFPLGTGIATQPDLGVTNGLFTIPLNFGPVFTGNAIWLAISVRSNGVGSYTTMTPLQELTPTPYSITAENVTGPITFAQLPAGLVTNNETGVTLSNVTVGGDLNLPATTIINSGGSSLLYADGAGNFFAGQGAGNETNSGFQNTGVGDGALVNNTADYNTAVGNGALFENTTGRINTATGEEALGFNTNGSGNMANGVDALWLNTSGSQNTAVGTGALLAATNGYNNIGVGYVAGESFTANESNNIDIGSSGVTGENNTIRLGTPGVQTTTYIAGVINGNGGGLTNLNISAGQLTSVGNSDGGSDNFFIGSSGNSTMSGSDNTGTGVGALGVNTSGSDNTAYGTFALAFNNTGSSNTAIGYETMALTGYGVFDTAIGAGALFHSSGGGNTAVGANALTANETGYNNTALGYEAIQSEVTSIDNVAVGVATFENNTTGIQNTAVGTYAFQNMTAGSGNVGLGYYAGNSLQTGTNNIYIGNPGGANENEVIRIGSGQTETYIDGTILFDGSDTNNGLAYITSGGLSGISSGEGPFLYGYYGGWLGAVGPTTVCLSWDYSGDVWVSNNLSTATLTIRGGSDLAEPFNITSDKDDVPQGSVMVIDDENPGRLKVSSQPYDTRVAGVLSGANGVNPGIQMQQQGLLEGGKNVALTGRVYVLADAAYGSIKPGDMLTTSATPGHAMKVKNHGKAQGAILGKAMSSLKQGKGMVLVLVTLQ